MLKSVYSLITNKFNMKQIKLFVSCPGDIIDELDSIRLVIDDINKTIGEQNSYDLKLLNWKTTLTHK